MNSVVQASDMRLMSAKEVRAHVDLIQDVLTEVMKENVHYGVIPGTKKKALYKAGAEKVMTTFRLYAEPQITDLSVNDVIRYRVVVKMISPTGAIAGFGVGECSSNEEKYKWREGVGKEFDETPDGRRRLKHRRGKNNTSYTVKQVRQEPEDVANTVLKMAKKRALVDGVLTATAASDIFDQGDEDSNDDHHHNQEVVLPPMAPSIFDKNFPTWQSSIQHGRRTVDQVIDKLSEQFTLSDSQRLKIRECPSPQADPRTSHLVKQAKALIDAGDIDAALDLMNQMESQSDREAVTVAVQEAQSESS